MNIAIFTNNYLPNPYGVSTSVEGFRQALTSMGHTVYIFAPEWGDATGKKEKNIFRYPAIKVPTKIDFSLVIPYSSEIDVIIEELDIDIIHAQHPNLLGSVAREWASKKDVPLVFTWHSLYDRYAHYTPFVPEKLSGYWAMSNAAGFAEKSDHIIVPTDSIIIVIKDAGVKHERISIVPSGVDEGLFASANGEQIRKNYHVNDDMIVLATVSRLTEEKNVLFLASVVAKVLKKNDKVVFLCGGEGDLREEMQNIFEETGVSKRVIFTGKIDRAEVKNYLVAGDIFVYASTSETQGTIVTENMYVGKPTVAVGENGVSNLIEDGINGIAVLEKEDEFVNSVQKLIDNKSLREEMGKNAYDIAREKYTTSACAVQLENVYKNVIKYYEMNKNE